MTFPSLKDFMIEIAIFCWKVVFCVQITETEISLIC
jgi:hypothetical protein